MHACWHMCCAGVGEDGGGAVRGGRGGAGVGRGACPCLAIGKGAGAGAREGRPRDSGLPQWPLCISTGARAAGNLHHALPPRPAPPRPAPPRPAPCRPPAPAPDVGGEQQRRRHCRHPSLQQGLHPLARARPAEAGVQPAQGGAALGGAGAGRGGAGRGVLSGRRNFERLKQGRGELGVERMRFCPFESMGSLSIPLP